MMAIFLILSLLAVHMSNAQGPPGIFQFEATEIRVSEASGSATVVIENTGNLAVSATVRVSTSANSTAQAGQDFLPLEGQLVEFSSGDSRKEVSIPIINDDEVEGEESFLVNLELHGPARPSAALGERTTLTVIIEDNDSPPPTQVTASNGGGNITLDYEAKIQVVCQADYIEVSLQIADYPGLIVNDSVLHLEDEACVAGYKDDSMVKFTFGLEACQTTMKDDGDKIYYMNNVYLQADEKAEDSAITRKHAEIIPFKCGYDKKTTISKVSYDPKSTLVLTDADGIGNFTYYMDMYEGANNNETVTKFPKEVGLGLRMYFGFRVESGDSELVVFPDVCKATASSSFDSTPDHLIIENACSKDNTLDYQYDKNSKHFFNLAAFRFKEGYDDVYIHCKLTICRSSDTDSRCDKGCEGIRRRRRSTEEDFSAELYVGPVRTKSQKFAEESADEESESSSGGMVVLVAVLVGVLGTVALGLIIAVVILSRRRNGSGKGASLIVAEEM